MKSLSAKAALQWVSTAGLKAADEYELLHYPGTRQHKFFIEAPEEYRRITYLIRQILVFRSQFRGALLWLRRWNIGSPSIPAGRLVLESIRRAYGNSQVLDIAPAQTFREDESLAAEAMLTQIVGFGWVADYVSGGDWFLRFKDNRQICCSARDPKTLKELRDHFGEWNPTDQDPMVLRMAAIAKARRAKARSRNRR